MDETKEDILITVLKNHEFIEEVKYASLVCKGIKVCYGIPVEYTKNNWGTLRQYADNLEDFVEQLRQTNPELFL